jgi:hypothetical protein
MKDDPMHRAQCPNICARRSLCREDELGKAMPIACGDRQWALPDARCRPGLRRARGAAQRQLQAWPLHRRGDCLPQVAEAPHSRSQGAD